MTNTVNEVISLSDWISSIRKEILDAYDPIFNIYGCLNSYFDGRVKELSNDFPFFRRLKIDKVVQWEIRENDKFGNDKGLRHTVQIPVWDFFTGGRIYNKEVREYVRKRISVYSRPTINNHLILENEIRDHPDKFYKVLQASVKKYNQSGKRNKLNNLIHFNIMVSLSRLLIKSKANNEVGYYESMLKVLKGNEIPQVVKMNDLIIPNLIYIPHVTYRKSGYILNIDNSKYTSVSSYKPWYPDKLKKMIMECVSPYDYDKIKKCFDKIIERRRAGWSSSRHSSSTTARRRVGVIDYNSAQSKSVDWWILNSPYKFIEVDNIVNTLKQAFLRKISCDRDFFTYDASERKAANVSFHLKMWVSMITQVGVLAAFLPSFGVPAAMAVLWSTFIIKVSDGVFTYVNAEDLAGSSDVEDIKRDAMYNIVASVLTHLGSGIGAAYGVANPEPESKAPSLTPSLGNIARLVKIGKFIYDSLQKQANIFRNSKLELVNGLPYKLILTLNDDEKIKIKEVLENNSSLEGVVNSTNDDNMTVLFPS